MKYSKETIILLPLVNTNFKVGKGVKSVKLYMDDGQYSLTIITDNGKLTVIDQLSIDDKYKDTIDLFIEGKYSQISETHKQKILKYWNATRDSVLFNVLYPKEYQYECYGLLTVKAELWTKPQVDFL